MEPLDDYEAAERGGYDEAEWRALLELAPDLADTPIEKRAATLEYSSPAIRYPAPKPEPKPVRYHKWRHAPNARGDWWGNTGFFRCEQCGKEERGTPQWAFSGESWYEIPGTDEPCQ